MELEIRPLRRDDRAEVAAWIEVCMRSMGVTRPGFEPRGLDATMRELASPQPGFVDHHLVGLVDGRIVTLGDWYLFGAGEPDKALVGVHTDPDHRGRGHGRAMADAVEARIDRPTLLSEIDYQDDWATDRDGRFAAARGYHAASFHTARALPWPADPALLDELERPTPGHRIESFVDGLPDQYVAGFGILHGLVDKDAPSGDIEWHDEPMGVEDYREGLARELEAGIRRVETLAFPTAPGADPHTAVAFTSVQIPPNPRRFINVGSTCVHRSHRGHGLGLAVKVAIERQLLAMDLPHPSIRTGNADDNTWMIAINEALGFVPVVRSVELVKRR